MLVLCIKIGIVGAFFTIAKVQYLLSQRLLNPALMKVKPVPGIDKRDSDGYTGLMKAAADGNLKDAQQFVRRGANVNARSDNMYQYTPLHLACQNGDFGKSIEIAKMLVRQGANVNAVDYQGSAPLHFTMNINNLGERLKLITFFINNGANINAQDSDRSTIFHLAVQQNDRECAVKLVTLFKGRISWNVKNKNGLTPFQLAESLGRTDIIRGLCIVAPKGIKDTLCAPYYYL